MSKAHRGKGLRELPKSGRGTCPVCGRTGVKVIYEQEIEGKKTKNLQGMQGASRKCEIAK